MVVSNGHEKTKTERVTSEEKQCERARKQKRIELNPHRCVLAFGGLLHAKAFFGNISPQRGLNLIPSQLKQCTDNNFP